jgi:3-oxoacyl-[acyl-carrier protein] reductase
MAVDLAEYGIRVNALSVGWTETLQLQSLPEEYRERKVSEIPMKRFASPEEIAEMAVFMISPLSSYLTGTVLPIAGGLWPDVR